MRITHKITLVAISFVVLSAVSHGQTYENTPFRTALESYIKANLIAETTHQKFLFVEKRYDMLISMSENLEKTGEFPFPEFWNDPEMGNPQFDGTVIKTFFLIHNLRQIAGDSTFFKAAATLIKNSSPCSESNLLELMKPDVDSDTYEKLSTTVDSFGKATNLPQFEIYASLHKDLANKQPFTVEGTLIREGDICNLYKIGYVIKLDDGSFFIGEMDMPGAKSEFKIATSLQPVSIEFDPNFDLYRYIPESDRENMEIRNESMFYEFDQIIVCTDGQCTIEEITK